MSIEEYNEGIKLLQKVAPDNGLLALAARGYSTVNCKYLETAIDTLPKVSEADKSQHDPTDPFVKRLYKEKNKLMLMRAKLSNSFHECATDLQRAGVSMKIAEVQILIARVMDQIDHYFAHGKPKVRINKGDDIPNDPVLLIKKRQNCRTMISRAKSDINAWSIDVIKNHKRIMTAEKSIKRNENKIKQIEKKLAAKGIH